MTVGGLAVFFARLADLAAFGRRALIVKIVKPHLHHFDFRALPQNGFQDVRLVVEGDAEMAYRPLFLETVDRVVRFAARKFALDVLVLGAHGVKIEIVHTEALQLPLWEGRMSSLRL